MASTIELVILTVTPRAQRKPPTMHESISMVASVDDSTTNEGWLGATGSPARVNANPGTSVQWRRRNTGGFTSVPLPDGDAQPAAGDQVTR